MEPIRGHTTQLVRRPCLESFAGTAYRKLNPVQVLAKERHGGSPETDNIITVTEEWDNVELKKINEQEQLTRENAELECKSLVESSVLKLVSRHAGDLGSDKNDNAENKDGANLKKNPSSSDIKKSIISNRKPQKNDMPLRNRNVRPPK
ncbi:Bifunctional protein GlmU, partial [Bienertia sinuspersici]